MPPTTQQVLDALEEMQKAPIPPGYRSVARSAALEIVLLQAKLKRAEYEVSRSSYHCD